MISSEKFEQSIQKLEALVKNLETGTLPLEEALAAFQEGVGLVKNCQSLLAQAEQKVDVLIKANAEGVETKPFSGSES
ncbi:MAG: exodeoxyribonuclease VII small subunit [Bdellovibrionales bacterium]|nr:exodeoxyribonuclease VII small subunit [Bdellovibrionales bacterium]